MFLFIAFINIGDIIWEIITQARSSSFLAYAFLTSRVAMYYLIPFKVYLKRLLFAAVI
jgi:hypothetical protein